MKNSKKFILLMIAGLFAVNTYSQLNDEGVLFTMNLGPAIIKNKTNDNNLNGYNLSLNLEKMTMEGTSAIGVSLGIIRSEAEYEIKDTVATYTITSHPALLSMKYIFGSEKLKGYAGVGFGVHFSKLNQGEEFIETITEPAVNIPIGFMWVFNEGIYLNVNYTFNYLAQSFYTNDLAHTISLGVGIQFGK